MQHLNVERYMLIKNLTYKLDSAKVRCNLYGNTREG